jgi:hypothetical protein
VVAPGVGCPPALDAAPKAGLFAFSPPKSPPPPVDDGAAGVVFDPNKPPDGKTLPAAGAAVEAAVVAGLLPNRLDPGEAAVGDAVAVVPPKRLPEAAGLVAPPNNPPPLLVAGVWPKIEPVVAAGVAPAADVPLVANNDDFGAELLAPRLPNKPPPLPGCAAPGAVVDVLPKENDGVDVAPAALVPKRLLAAGAEEVFADWPGAPVEGVPKLNDMSGNIWVAELRSPYY